MTSWHTKLGGPMDAIDHYCAAFWSNVDRTGNGCWLWHGDMDGKGYGRFPLFGVRRGAHKTAYELSHGPIPRGLWVLHHCDNKRCVNPDHLYAGTIYDNVRDVVYRGKHGGANKTHCPQGHPYSGDNLIIRTNPRARICRICRTAKNKRATLKRFLSTRNSAVASGC